MRTKRKQIGRWSLLVSSVAVVATTALSAAPASANTAPIGGGGGGCSTTGAAVCPSKCSKDFFGEVHGNYIYFYTYKSRDSYGYWKFDVASPFPPAPARHVGYAYKFCG